MALRTRVWSAGKLVLLGGGLVATYVLFAAASMRVALRAREVQVPDFTNRTANEATVLATNLGLAMKVDDTRRPDPKIGAGRVVAQEPSAGATARLADTLIDRRGHLRTQPDLHGLEAFFGAVFERSLG